MASGGASLLLLLLIAGPVVHGAASNVPSDGSNLCCSDQFTLYKEHCYRYFGLSTKRAYFHAQKYCHRHQSSLVSIHSEQEELFVLTLAQSNGSFWIGLSDQQGPEGVFRWDTGEGMEGGYVNWRQGEPDNKQHLDCVKADNRGWSMASGGCASNKLPFVCKRQACPQGLDLYNGQCTVILTEQSSWLSSCYVFTVAMLVLLSITSCIVTCTRLWSTSDNKSIEHRTLRTHLAAEDPT